MPQIQGPPPTITGVDSLNLALRVFWQLDPYVDAGFDATLLLINTTTNTMQSILLDATQILEEEYLVTNLVNGNEYAILFSILDASGNTNNSNTVFSIPSDVPEPPVIVSYTLQPGFKQVLVKATLGDNGGAPITSVVFRVLREGVAITSEAFPDASTNLYLVGSDPSNALVPGSDYIISCQALNPAGYSNVSNSIAFRNSSVPNTPALAVIQSGSNASAILPISGSNQSEFPITSFTIFNNLTTLLATVPVTTPIFGAYALDLSLNALTNGTSYSLSVKAVNSAGSSLHSNVKTVVPALRLVNSGVTVSFPDASSILVAWTQNASAATWGTTGTSTVSISGTNIPVGAVAPIVNNNNTPSTLYTLPAGSTLVSGATYSVTINSYAVVPQILYPSKWISPTLVNYEYTSLPVSKSQVYATVPGVVSNIDYVTDIAQDGSGAIQFTWTAAASNGSPITSYSCQLYTVASGLRTPLGAPIVTNATNVLFNFLNTSLFYAVGIRAVNAVGSGPVTFYPASANFGIQIVAAVDPVTNLVGSQTSYVNSTFSGQLTWNYAGPGQGYTGAIFNVYSVVNGSQTLLGNVPYVVGTASYQFPVSLGSTANVTSNFVVEVTALASGGLSTSIGVFVSITTGVAPIISNVVVVNNGNNTGTLTFTVTDTGISGLIPQSLCTIVPPFPVAGVTSAAIINKNYDTSLVVPGGSFTYVETLPYTPLPNYYFIECCNGFGTGYAIDGFNQVPSL